MVVESRARYIPCDEFVRALQQIRVASHGSMAAKPAALFTSIGCETTLGDPRVVSEISDEFVSAPGWHDQMQIYAVDPPPRLGLPTELTTQIWIATP